MDITETLNQLSGSTLGVNLFEDEIDDVVFATNSFLTDPSFSGPQGPFWWILQMSMALGALFAIIMGANMAYKMMVRGGDRSSAYSSCSCRCSYSFHVVS